MKNKNSESGLLSLEASISLTIFMFFMLFLYSFFTVFEARNEIAHVVLASANSLALDTYENKTMGQSGTLAQILSGIYHSGSPNEDGFVDSDLWSEIKVWEREGSWNGTIYAKQPDGSDVTDEDDYGKSAVISTRFDKAIKERFVAYLSGGSTSEADKILKRYHIVNGINGLDFSGSHISSGKIYLSVKYKLEYEYNAFGLGTLEMEQSACSKTWK